VILIHQRHRQTDRRTDGQTDGQPAISIPRYALVHRAVKIEVYSLCYSFHRAMHYRAKGGITIACRPSVRLSVMLLDLDHDHIGWKSCKLIARTISPTPSLFLAQRPSTYTLRLTWGNLEESRGEEGWEKVA